MFANILLSVDLQDEVIAGKLTETARAICDQDNGRLSVMTVVPDPGMSIVGSFLPEGHMQAMLETARKNLHQFTEKHFPGRPSIRHVIAQGNVYEEVLETAGKLGCDLIIVGAHRPSAADFLLGPNAARIARHAQCSVLVVRQD